MKVGVTGTRKGPTEQQTSDIIHFLTTRPIEEFHHGDCIGVDEAAARIASRRGIHIVGHPPIDPKARAYFPSDEERPAQDFIQRNHNIVNEVDLLIVVPGEAHERKRSGTWATYRYANQQKVQVLLLLPEVMA
jgi:hypothetical protein